MRHYNMRISRHEVEILRVALPGSQIDVHPNARWILVLVLGRCFNCVDALREINKEITASAIDRALSDDLFAVCGHLAMTWPPETDDPHIAFSACRVV